MKTAFSLAVLLSACLTAWSSEDIPFPWQAVTLEFGYGLGDEHDKEQLTRGTLRIATRDYRITELTLDWNRTKFSVPAAEFASVPGPQLETLKVLRGKFYGNIFDNAPYVVVELRFGQPTLGEHPRAHFLFFSGRYHELRITTRTSPTTWVDAVKQPGKESTPAGTTTLLLPDTTQSAASPDKKPKEEPQ